MWIFKEKKFENAPASPQVGGSGLGSTSAGQTIYEGLPRDEDLDAEAAAAAAAEQNANYGNSRNMVDDDEQPQPPANPRSRRSDFGILA